MSKATILLAGGSGFVGQHLTSYFEEKGYVLHILTRAENPTKLNKKNVEFYYWNPQKGIIDEEAFNGVSTILNLSGANIGEKRWTESRKREIVDSRILSTRLLFETAKNLNAKVEKIISSSAVGYYGMQTTSAIFTESSPLGKDFLANVCLKWENEARRFEEIGTKVVILRKGIIIGNGGAYKKLASLAKFGINTSLGDGKQFMPWIDISDLSRIYELALENREIHGIYNAVSDEHIRMKDFARNLANSLNAKILTPPAPGFFIRIILGEMAGMLLQGSRISNDRLRNLGFEFQFSRIIESFNSLSNK